MQDEATKWDYSAEVVIVGSGNGALTAALCCYEMGIQNVLLIEKADQYGGTSSIGGGGLWIPCSHYAREAGAADDSLEEALTYLQNTVPAEASSENMLRTFLENGPKMLRFMHDRTHMRYVSLGEYPDYYTSVEGAREGHRSMEPASFNITRLENRGDGLRPTHPMMYMMDQIPISQKDAHILVGQLSGWMLLGAKLVLQYFLDIPQRLRTRRSRKSTCGSAGVGRLALSVQDRNIPLWLDTEMRDLIVENNRVVGIRAIREGAEISIQGAKAVILAAGGFEHNQQMREKYLPQPTNTNWSSGNRGNTGLPIEKAMEKGAAIKGMDGAWWCTTFSVPGKAYPFLSIMEKSLPGSCVVNKHGKRVANESMNYQAYVQACFKAREEGVDVDDLWMVFDARFRANYIVGPMMTSKLLPDAKLPRELFCDEFLTMANSIDELAEKVGINKARLNETITNMTDYARSGEDLEFKRGSFAYDRYYGDPDVKPNNCLAPMVESPYYAVRLSLGDFGTNGGLVINEHAQVLKEDDSVMAGLYATGNCSAPLLPSYPGPGSTLGPAMTFAYQAAKSIAHYSD
ncbi:MAG: FAD-binding protein [Halieaceae bacterium]|jgi:3-oxosteroid 1-dehydrogenase|nr:FAD-binding protein [Halieaceae bacterium]